MKRYRWILFDKSMRKKQVTIDEANIYQKGNIKQYKGKSYRIETRIPGGRNGIEFCIAFEI